VERELVVASCDHVDGVAAPSERVGKLHSIVQEPTLPRHFDD